MGFTYKNKYKVTQKITTIPKGESTEFATKRGISNGKTIKITKIINKISCIGSTEFKSENFIIT